MIYDEKSMVKKEHVKIIVKELSNLGSKIPQNLHINNEHSLANLLSLACGSGKYRLEPNIISQIKSDEFSIKEGAIKLLCEKSATNIDS